MFREWPLVAFTILGQTAAGIGLLVLLPLALSNGDLWNARGRETVLMILAVVFGLLVLAALLSFFHLGHPFRARRVLANLRTSWLSREILFELAFLAFVALAFVLVRTGNTQGLFFKTVLGGAALAGSLFLVSMGKLYMLESVPSWDFAYTGISFFLTALTLGAMATAWITGAPTGNPNSYFSTLWTVAFFFIAGDVFFAAILTPRYGLAGFRPGPSLRPPASAPRMLHFGRLAFLAGGLILIVLAMGVDIPGALNVQKDVARHMGRPLLTLAFVLVLMGEVAGRFFFYGLAGRPGD
jgi:anaerobic dimethyl sulfoxide reductase subunit C (anchor subunit)